ncbi:aldo/keto reductase [Neisseriaceae bacterium TC5R-5]|nr:aldo/keto reductase [Neisseriaceae bacterium TC5R-5]
MKNIRLGDSQLYASEIALGCMRMAELSVSDAHANIACALEQGINLFDHADIYGAGKSEEIFAAALQHGRIRRDDIILQTKCGIREGFFDFSKEHIIQSVESSLSRLNTDYIDVLLLHRPDTLFDEEVAAAFDALQDSGKVRYFGVSNQKPLQMALLQKYVSQKLIINQLQFSLAHAGMIDSGLYANMKVAAATDHDGSVLEYCRLNDITIQAWSPFQYGSFAGTFLNNPDFAKLNQVINELAHSHSVSNSAIAIAWILRHPAKLQAIIGSMNLKRIEDICQAAKVQLSRQEWYRLYCAAGNPLP